MGLGQLKRYSAFWRRLQAYLRGNGGRGSLPWLSRENKPSKRDRRVSCRRESARAPGLGVGPSGGAHLMVGGRVRGLQVAAAGCGCCISGERGRRCAFHRQWERRMWVELAKLVLSAATGQRTEEPSRQFVRRNQSLFSRSRLTPNARENESAFSGRAT